MLVPSDLYEPTISLQKNISYCDSFILLPTLPHLTAELRDFISFFHGGSILPAHYGIQTTNDKLTFAHVNINDIIHAAPFNTQQVPDSLVMVTENILMLGTIDDIQKLHIKKVPLGEQPRRIAYDKETHILAVCTVKNMLDDDEINNIKIFDDISYEIKDSYQLMPHEHACSILVTRLPSQDFNSFIIGTAFAFPHEAEPTKGRLLILRVIDNQIIFLSETWTSGAVYTIAQINGGIICGINSQVVLYQNDDNDHLVEKCSHQGHILALYLSTYGDYILLGDLMKSMSLLSYNNMTNSIEEVARDYDSNWMTSVSFISDSIFLGSDNSFNLFTLHRCQSDNEEKRGELVSVGRYHLGDFVNVFRSGSLVMILPNENENSFINTTSMLPSQVLFGTVSGSIGVLLPLLPSQYEFLSNLQNLLVATIPGVGGLNHQEFRSFYNERKTENCRNFIDGDLIESFMLLPKSKMEDIAKQMNISCSSLIKIVEELIRIH